MQSVGPKSIRWLTQAKPGICVSPSSSIGDDHRKYQEIKSLTSRWHTGRRETDLEPSGSPAMERNASRSTYMDSRDRHDVQQHVRGQRGGPCGVNRGNEECKSSCLPNVQCAIGESTRDRTDVGFCPLQNSGCRRASGDDVRGSRPGRRRFDVRVTDIEGREAGPNAAGKKALGTQSPTCV